MRANVFTYLDGRSRNKSQFVIKTTSRFRETERTLVLKIQLLMNSTTSEETVTNLQNHRLMIAQSPAGPALLYPMIL